jgi:phosphoglycerol transferase
MSLAVEDAVPNQALPPESGSDAHLPADRPATSRVSPRDVWWLVATAVACLIVAAIALELWRADLSVPFAYAGDELFSSMVIKDLLEHGWWLSNPSLGAPFVQQMADFPQGEASHFLLIKVIGALVRDPAVTLNLFYLLSFPLTGIAGALFFRALGASRAVSFGVGLLFAFLPYHVIRGTPHLSLVAYYALPAAAFLATSTWQGRAFFGLPWSRPDMSPRRLGAGVLLPVGLCILIGASPFYFSWFSIILLAIATLGAFLQGRSRASVVSGVLIVGLVGATILAILVPTVLLQVSEGRNTDAAVRFPYESQRYSLQLADLILPIEQHRLRPLRELAAARGAAARLGRLPDERAAGLGLASVIGLVVMIVAVLRPTGTSALRSRAPVVALAALTGAAFLVGTTGGLSALIALLATPQFRASSRIELFIGLFALGALALFIDGIHHRFRARFTAMPARLAGAAVLGALLVAALLDQTSPAFVPPYSRATTEFRADRAYFRTIESRLPPGSSVLQLPLIPFPEWATRPGGYPQLKPYLHTQQLRWSFGLVKGREAGWQSYLTPRAAHPSLRLALLAGYSAVLVLRPAYADGGREVEQSLRAETGQEPLVSQDGTWAFYEIGSSATRILQGIDPSTVESARGMVLEPVRLMWPQGASPMYGDELHRKRDLAPVAKLSIRSASAGPRNVHLQLRLESLESGPVPVTIAWPGEVPQAITVPSGGELIDRSITVPAGGLTIELVSPASGAVVTNFGRKTLRVIDPWVIDEELLRIIELPAS